MIRLSRYLPVVAACAALATMVMATPALAADSIEPANIDVELRPGQTYEVTKQVHLDAAPAKADIVVALDTTDTMAPVLAQAKAEAAQLVAQLQSLIPGARFALFDFRDYHFARSARTADASPCSPPPDGSRGTFPCALRTDGLTADAGAVQAAINGMTNGTGGSPGQPKDPKPPAPEAYNRVFYEATAEAKLVGRGPEAGGYDPKAERFLVVLGDEVGRDVNRPARDARFGACPTSKIVDPGRNGVPEDGGGDDLKTEAVIDGLSAARTSLLMINYKGESGRSYLDCYKQLAQPTGGDAWPGGDPAQVRDRIVTAITEASARINKVELQVAPADCPLTYSFANTADGSPPPWGPLRGPVDFSFTERVKAPETPGSYACEVRVIVDGAQRAVQRFHANVVEPTTTTTTTTSTTLPTTTTAPPPPPPAAEPKLPFTGAGMAAPLLTAGLGLLGLGALALLGARRRRSS